MRQVVDENEHVRLDVDEERQIVWLVRSASRARSPAESQRGHRCCFRAPAAGFWGRGGLVVATRAALGRNDGEFEAGLREQRASFGVFARAVVLVRSAVGELHLQRLAREEGLAILVTRDEAEAERLAAR
jgi:hypothetical protein